MNYLGTWGNVLQIVKYRIPTRNLKNNVTLMDRDIATCHIPLGSDELPPVAQLWR